MHLKASRKEEACGGEQFNASEGPDKIVVFIEVYYPVIYIYMHIRECYKPLTRATYFKSTFLEPNKGFSCGQTFLLPKKTARYADRFRKKMLIPSRTKLRKKKYMFKKKNIHPKKTPPHVLNNFRKLHVFIFFC